MSAPTILTNYVKFCCRFQQMLVRSSSFVAPSRPTIKVTDEKSVVVEVSAIIQERFYFTESFNEIFGNLTLNIPVIYRPVPRFLL